MQHRAWDSPAPSDYTTLTAVLSRYEAAGYATPMTIDANGEVRCGECGTTHNPASASVESLRRLEGASDPADMAAVVAVRCESCGSAGTAVVRFGPEATEGDAAFLLAAADRRLGPTGVDGAVAPGEDRDRT